MNNEITLKRIIYNHSVKHISIRNINIPNIIFKLYHSDNLAKPDIYLYLKFKDNILYGNILSSSSSSPFTKIGTVKLNIEFKPTDNDIKHLIVAIIATRMHQPNIRKKLKIMLNKYKVNLMFNNIYLNDLKDYLVNNILTKRIIDFNMILDTPFNKDLVQYYFAIDKIKYCEIKFGLTLK